MIKIALFLEGHTELIFVREMLLKIFDYTDISIKCFNLPRDNDFQPADYDYEVDNPVYVFHLNNTGTDSRVLSAILKHEVYFWNIKFHRIIGLMDMFSEKYKKAVQTNQIKDEITEKFIQKHQETITEKAIKPTAVFMFFAIMEIEAWILGLKKDFTDVDTSLTAEYIEANLQFDLNTIDPERLFFHPATKGIEAIYTLVGKKYDKNQEEVNKLMASISKNDFLFLRNAPQCNSFKDFFDALLIDEKTKNAVELLIAGFTTEQIAEETSLLNTQIENLNSILTQYNM